MKIRELTRNDRPEWLRMRLALWPENPPAEVAAEVAEFFNTQQLYGQPTAVFVVDRGGGKLGGFVEVSRRPAAAGCVTSPVGYVEGWYIDGDLRRKHLGARLIEAAEQWAIDSGCAEMASDCYSHNLVSYAAHQALGYANAAKDFRLHKPLASTIEPASEWIGVVPFPLDEGMITKLVSDPRAGGVCVFSGTTRAETSKDGKELLALDYEAYTEMAMRQLNALAASARERWPIIKLALLHRVGRVEVGQPSVVIAVACGHRKEAFEACRYLIDDLKRDVAIWKKEVWADGPSTWVNSPE